VVALLDLEDIVVVIGRGPESGAEAAQWQWYINSVSAYINDYVDVSFETKTGDVVRYQADYYGMIDLGGGPVSTVSSVKNVRSNAETSWVWDGLTTLSRLDPNEVVDVTYTHGYSAVPDDIKHVATQAISDVLGLGATGTLTSFTVGDVTEAYSKPTDEGSVTVVSLSKDVLDRYSSVYSSWRLGYRDSNVSNILPTL
jgi:hypothetical protein